MTPEELAAIRDDIAKYPTRYDGRRNGWMGEHDPVVYCRALLAHIDAITEAVEGLPRDESTPGDPLIDLSSVLALLRGTP